MARYDKYEPYAGGFRAPLNADWLVADIGKPYGVGLNAQGNVVKGAGQTGVIGVLILTMARKAGEIVDVMTDGEITEWAPTAGVPGTDEGVAGTRYFSDAAGAITATSAAGSVSVGHTVEGTRLITRVSGRVV